MHPIVTFFITDMEMQNFEKKLEEMTKPEVPQLRHQEQLTNALVKAKNRSVVSWWWLSIPLYIIGALLMKTAFVPHSSFFSNLKLLADKEWFIPVLFFVVLPVAIVTLNFITIKKVYYLMGNPRIISFLTDIWLNILIVICSVMVLFIYTFEIITS